MSGHSEITGITAYGEITIKKEEEPLIQYECMPPRRGSEVPHNFVL